VWPCSLPIVLPAAHSHAFGWHLDRVAAFYTPLPKIKLPAVTGYAVHRALLQDAYWESQLVCVLLTIFCGGLMNLAHSAFWDALEPKLIGKKGFGQGDIRRVPQRPPKGNDGAPRPTVDRVTAASAVASGDPQRGESASAFTQSELDTLAKHGIQPWDEAARAALKKL
jgi:hypothetical protein